MCKPSSTHATVGQEVQITVANPNFAFYASMNKSLECRYNLHWHNLLQITMCVCHRPWVWFTGYKLFQMAFCKLWINYITIIFPLLRLDLSITCHMCPALPYFVIMFPIERSSTTPINDFYPLLCSLRFSHNTPSCQRSVHCAHRTPSPRSLLKQPHLNNLHHVSPFVSAPVPSCILSILACVYCLRSIFFAMPPFRSTWTVPSPFLQLLPIVYHIVYEGCICNHLFTNNIVFLSFSQYVSLTSILWPL